MIAPEGDHECRECASYEREVKALKSKLDIAVGALRRHGYRERCDIPACNCGEQWNHGGHASQRLSELRDVIGENGKTLLQSAESLMSRLDRAYNLLVCAEIPADGPMDGAQWRDECDALLAEIEPELKRQGRR